MTLQQLVFVVEVAKTNSINKAAEKLYVHQSNVSNAIKQLESEYGITIFNRSQRGVTLTESGREFISYAEEIVTRSEFLEKRYLTRRGKEDRSYHIMAMRAYFLTEPLQRSPEELLLKGEESGYLRLEKSSFEKIVESVARGISDVGVVFMSPSQTRMTSYLSGVNNLDFTELGVSHMNLIFRRDHPLLKEPNFDNLDQYPYIIAEMRENFAHLYDESGISLTDVLPKIPRNIISTNDSTTCQYLVAATDAFYISSMRHQRVDQYRFVSVPLDSPEAVLTHYLVTRRDYSPPDYIQKYIEVVKTLYGDL